MTIEKNKRISFVKDFTKGFVKETKESKE